MIIQAAYLNCEYITLYDIRQVLNTKVFRFYMKDGFGENNFAIHLSI